MDTAHNSIKIIKRVKNFSLFWVASLLLFSSILGMISAGIVDFNRPNPFDGFMLIVFLIDILAGCLAFLFMIGNIGLFLFKHRTSPKNLPKGSLNFIGIAAIFLVISAFVTLEASNVIQVAGYSSRNQVTENPFPSIAPKPKEAVLAEQTEAPTPTPEIKQTAAKPKITPPPTSGGRTGEVVKYKEYCQRGKEISVYSGELITKKGDDGVTYSMTKEDWDCYDADRSQRNSGQNSNLIDCNLNGQTYRVTQSTCDSFKADTSITPLKFQETSYSCPVFNAEKGKTEYFFLTISECGKKSDEQRKLNDEYNQARSEYNKQTEELERQHSDACQRAYGAWVNEKQEFYSGAMNNYSSSADALRELERRRGIRQQQMYSAGCNQTL